MLRWRLLGAACILAPLLTILWLDDQHNAGYPGIWAGGLALFVALLATGELNQLMARAALPTSPTVNLWGVSCVVVCSLVPIVSPPDPADPMASLSWTLVGVAIAVASIFTCELYRYRVPGESISRLSGGMLATVYIGVMFGFLMQLRLLQPGRGGLILVIATILIVKLSDTGAFFTGKTWGRHRFSVVSPKKTVEGVLGGIAAAVVAALFVREVLLPYTVANLALGSRVAYIGYGACLAVAGLLGDLSESLLKRDVGQKDSSLWLRGLGGVLDVTDSILSTAPVSYFWWAMGWL